MSYIHSLLNVIHISFLFFSSNFLSLSVISRNKNETKGYIDILKTVGV